MAHALVTSKFPDQILEVSSEHSNWKVWRFQSKLQIFNNSFQFSIFFKFNQLLKFSGKTFCRPPAELWKLFLKIWSFDWNLQTFNETSNIRSGNFEVMGACTANCFDCNIQHWSALYNHKRTYQNEFSTLVVSSF